MKQPQTPEPQVGDSGAPEMVFDGGLWEPSQGGQFCAAKGVVSLARMELPDDHS